MALYRCAACGSPNVRTDTQNGKLKYSYLKGAIGTAVLGAGGAVAGLSQETEHVFKCPDCGTVLSYPMDAKTCSMIDLGVASKKARANLPVPWEAYTRLYKNIEKGSADFAIEEREAKFEAKATASKDEFDTAVALLADISNAKYSKNNPMPKEVYGKGKAAIYTFIENLYRYLPPARLEGAAIGAMYNGLRVDSSALTMYFWDYWLFWHEDNRERLAFKGHILPHTDIREACLATSLLQTCDFAKVFVKKYTRCLNRLCYLEKYDGVGESSGMQPTPKFQSLFWTPPAEPHTTVSGVSIMYPLAFPTFTYTGDNVHCYFEFEHTDNRRHFPSADGTAYIESYLANNPDQKEFFDKLLEAQKEKLECRENYSKAEKSLKEFSEKQKELINGNLSRISSLQNEIAMLNKKIFGRTRAKATAAALEIKVQDLLKENTAIEQSIKDEESKLGEEPIYPYTEEFSKELFALMDYFLP